MDEYQRRRLIKIVMSHIQSFKGKRAAVLGFAYKASTSDSRGSPSVDLVRALLQEGASVYIYDPRVAAEDVMKACDYHRDVHVAGAVFHLTHCSARKQCIIGFMLFSQMCDALRMPCATAIVWLFAPTGMSSNP